MKVYLSPIGLHSRAMVRVANALTRYAPNGIEIVSSINQADLVVLHVIGYDAIEFADKLYSRGQKYAIIQYVRRATNYTSESDWDDLWHSCEFVMSYYDLAESAGRVGFRFHHAPLGVDDCFIIQPNQVNGSGRNLVITTGYVSNQYAEPIEEVWQACEQLGLMAIHVGPNRVEGMVNYPQSWKNVEGISDRDLASLYRQARCVSGLRHQEGFEMPAIEGLACGARPIVFDQPSMRHWYRDHAAYVPDCHGDELVEHLYRLMNYPISVVTDSERQQVIERFNWEHICGGFWDNLER